MSGLSIRDIHKSFGEKRALDGVSFDVAESEIVAILGPSGCGKSTLLYTIAGLERQDRGDILWDGLSLADTPPHRRGFGLMFQDFALFPHRNVYENAAFGLRMASRPESEIAQRVREVLALVGLPGFEKRDVNTLSGGEAQRVALARSLAPQPRLLMLDEPLGSLDRNLRERLVLDLGQILRLSRQTALYVTHDLQEAFTLAGRVVVMNAGRVEQIGAPQEIYRRPGNAFVARFLGLNNLVAGRAVTSGETGQACRIETPVGVFPCPAPLEGAVTVLIRPDQARIVGTNHPTVPGDGRLFRLHGILKSASFQGSTCQAAVEVNGTLLEFEFPSAMDLPGSSDPITLEMEIDQAIQAFPAA